MASVVAAEEPRVGVPLGGALVALAAYSILVIPLGGWLVDDAAISMAYAANWAAGHGLVAQPGLEAVEGYSNFLWVVALALLNLAGAMTPAAIKCLSLVLVGCSLVSLHFTCRHIMPSTARWAALLLVATNSSIVTWTTSGLENPLTLLFSCELLRVVSEARRNGIVRSRAVYAALLVAAMGMTRPEGIAFAAFAPLALAKSRQWKMLALYLATIAVVYLSFLTFRFATFHDWVPNTFYAKDAHLLSALSCIVNLAVLFNGPFGSAFVFLGLFVAAYKFMKADDRLVPPLALMVVAGSLFILMPPDWMPDRRFATAFVPAACVFGALVLGQFSRWRTALLMGLLAVSVGVSSYRLASLYRAPTMPMADVRQMNAEFEDTARQRRIAHASLLMPDIGAALLESKLRIFDLAGLTDRVIGRTLHRDKQRFHDYVFEELRPTFIKIHGPWAEIADFDSDPRFRRDYAPLTETTDPWLLEHRGIAMKSGEYIRRDH